MKKLRVAIIAMMWPLLIFGQTDTSDYSLIPAKDYLKSYLTDTKQVFSSVSDFDTRDWLTAGAVVTTGAVLITQDKAINRFWRQNGHPFADKTVEYGLEPFGRGIYPVAIAGGLYLHATVRENSYNRHVALTTAKALIISQMVTQVSKQMFHRHRPIDPNPGKWEGPVASTDLNSFPSGHSTMAFSFAAVMAHAYNDNLWIPVTSYTVAALSAFSRVYDNEHWASDVLIGSAIGFFIGRSLWRMNDPEKMQIQITGQGVGIRIPVH